MGNGVKLNPKGILKNANKRMNQQGQIASELGLPNPYKKKKKKKKDSSQNGSGGFIGGLRSIFDKSSQ